MGFLSKLCLYCFSSSPSPSPPLQASSKAYGAHTASSSSHRWNHPPRHGGGGGGERRVHRIPVGHQPLPSQPKTSQAQTRPQAHNSGPVPPPQPTTPQKRSRRHGHRVRRSASEAHIQRYDPGQFGPPGVTTGPPLREEWINPGTKKKFVYSNADVIWRSNERRIGWENRVFYEDDPYLGPYQISRNGAGFRGTHANVTERGQMTPRDGYGMGRLLNPVTGQEEDISVLPRRSVRRNGQRSRVPPGAPLQTFITLPDTDTNIFMSQSYPYSSVSPSKSPRIHLDLAYRTLSSQAQYSCAHWDIRLPPKSNAVRYHLPQVYYARGLPRTVSSPNFYATAIYPPSRRIWITVGLPQLISWMHEPHWGSISVRPGVGGEYVTVSDVLGAIYESFQIPLTRDDLASVPASGPWRGMLEQARERRERSVQWVSDPGAGYGAGFVRADLLNDHTRFAGLFWDETGGKDRWVLGLAGQTSLE